VLWLAVTLVSLYLVFSDAVVASGAVRY